MLTLVTGVPGAGKTLWTVTTVKARAEREGRQVFYSGIPDLQLPWTELPEPIKYVYVDPKTGKSHETTALDPHWSDVPDGSIVVLDEAWCFFPTRKQGAPVPEYVQPLATHRHRGLDIYVTTQAGTQLDIFVRKLVGDHVHLDRRFGMQRAALLRWASCKSETSSIDRAAAVRETFNYPKSSYGLYKSAEVHTHKLSLPWKKLVLMGGALVGTVLFASLSYGRLHGTLGGAVKGAPVAVKGKQPLGFVQGSAGTRGMPLWAPGARLPRYKGVAESAPAYDQVEMVKSAPAPRGCAEFQIGSALVCTCTDSQGGVLDIPVGKCVDMVKHGWFDPTRPPEDENAENIAYLNARDAKDQDSGTYAPAPAAGGGGGSDTSSSSSSRRPGS